MPKFSLKFEPPGTEIKVRAVTTLLQAARENRVLISAPCGGRGLCGGCRVRIKPPSGEPPVSPEDSQHLSEKQLAGGWRLACRHSVRSDLLVRLPDQGDFPRAKLELLALESDALPPRGAPRKTLFVPRESTLKELNIPLEEALLQALPPQTRSPLPLSLAGQFASLIRRGCGKLTLVTENDRLIGIEAGDTTAQVLGAAVDIGTTTIALYLCDLREGKVLSGSAAANSQAAFGADVMSRIGHCIENPKGLEQLGRLVRADVTRLLGEACTKAGVEPEYLYRWVLVGNTTMQHLFLGLDPESLGRSPYLPLVNGAVEFQPAELGLKAASCARGVFLPTVAGHVGADLVAVALAAGLKENGGLSLAVDLGTNGEIVLADRGRLLCCSTAAGPAFEGARISYGMRAEPGAIDRFWIDGKGQPQFHVIGDKKVPAGICGSGLLDLAAELLRVGIIDSSGWILPPEKLEGKLAKRLVRRLEPGENGQWQFVVYQRVERGRTSRVALTQRDVRELQLAGGAISSGIRILLKMAGRSAEELDQVLLTGAFGHYLNPASAVRIGLISGVRLERIQSIGNAAGLGARLALLDTEKLEESCRLAAEMEFVELAALPDWQDEFTESMFFPER